MRSVPAKPEAVFEVREGVITTPEGPLLQELSFRVPRDRVTALVGPSGTGKSVLLRAMSGLLPGPDWFAGGVWRARGETVGPPTYGGPPLSDILHVRQRKRGGLQGVDGTLEDVRQARISFLDEPTLWWPARDVTSAVRCRASGATVVLVTHDVGLARALADHVLLLCAGQIVAQGTGPEFFELPPNDLAVRFVTTGNCWTRSLTVPETPSHFKWILPSRLAGMGRPGLLRDVDEDLASIACAGIEFLASLTETAFPTEKLREYGIASHHLPIVDMGVPSVRRMATLCRTMERYHEQGKATAVHCRAGLGRTGTALASMLVWRGYDADEAIRAVRRVARGYLQTKSQEKFVHRFAAEVGIK